MYMKGYAFARRAFHAGFTLGHLVRQAIVFMSSRPGEWERGFADSVLVLVKGEW